MSPTTSDAEGQSSPSTLPTNVFFRLAIFPVVALILTVFALVASLFGDPTAPVNGWLSRYSGPILAVEVVVSLLFSLIALAVDRRRLLLEEKGSPPAEAEGIESI